MQKWPPDASPIALMTKIYKCFSAIDFMQSIENSKPGMCDLSSEKIHITNCGSCVCIWLGSRGFLFVGSWFVLLCQLLKNNYLQILTIQRNFNSFYLIDTKEAQTYEQSQKPLPWVWQIKNLKTWFFKNIYWPKSVKAFIFYIG